MNLDNFRIEGECGKVAALKGQELRMSALQGRKA